MEWKTAEEKREYEVLESAALDFYTGFKASHAREIGSHFLKLKQKLMPMRIACAGGHTPMEGSNSADEDGNPAEEPDDEQHEDDGTQGRKKAKQAVKYSDFAFSSKVKWLIQELKDARDKDPTCM